MAAVRHRGLWNQKWGRCGRCGFEYPESMLVIQKGLKVCTQTCFDDTDIEHRDEEIQNVLADGGDGAEDNIEEQTDELEF